MKSLNEICQEYPEHEVSARETIARAHELWAIVRGLEPAPNDTWTYKKEVKEARAEYEEFYKKQILESGNPIIKELNAQ